MAESTRAIITAAAANLAIAVAKFVGAGLTGSSAMLSEGAHSVVDTANQALLLFGLHRAKRPADAQHPFGYGRELYFYSFVVQLAALVVIVLASLVCRYRSGPRTTSRTMKSLMPRIRGCPTDIPSKQDTRVSRWRMPDPPNAIQPRLPGHVCATGSLLSGLPQPPVSPRPYVAPQHLLRGAA